MRRLALPAVLWVAARPGARRRRIGQGGRRPFGPEGRVEQAFGEGQFPGAGFWKSKMSFGLLLIFADNYNIKTDDPTTERTERTETFLVSLQSGFQAGRYLRARGPAAPGSRLPASLPRDSRSCGLPHGRACPRGPTAWAQWPVGPRFRSHAKPRRPEEWRTILATSLLISASADDALRTLPGARALLRTESHCDRLAVEAWH